MRPTSLPAFARDSRARLTGHDLGRFPTNTLFDRIGRAVCAAGCLPRRELFEAWEMARRVRRRCRGGRIVDAAGGHGLLAQILLLLDDSSPEAIVVDPKPPNSAAALQAALVSSWPRLAGRVRFIAQDIDDVELHGGDLVVCCHGCGALTDRVIERASSVRARVAALPCCHDEATGDTGPLAGWMDAALAMDTLRALRLESRGYDVRTLTIPAEITSKNRLLIGEPRAWTDQIAGRK